MASSAVVLIAVGDVGGAHNALAVGNAGPPTAASRAARTLADGLRLALALLGVELKSPAS